jgi:hypothetical protein
MAAGSGLTAGADTSITNTIIGAGSGYTTPTNNWWALFTNQFTAAAKLASTGVEWLVASDSAYARQPMGASGAGWTVAAYASSVGVVWKNTNTLTQPAVTGANQSLFACGWMDTVGPTGGNCDFFIDLGVAQAVNIGTAVILTASTGAVFTTY